LLINLSRFDNEDISYYSRHCQLGCGTSSKTDTFIGVQVQVVLTFLHIGCFLLF